MAYYGGGDEHDARYYGHAGQEYNQLNASTYSVDAGGHYDDGRGHSPFAGAPLNTTISGGHGDLYDDGERSPLAANAQHPAGAGAGIGYPPAGQQQQHQGQQHSMHPTFIQQQQPSFLKQEPYGYGGASNEYLPPAGFYPNRAESNYSRADSDAEWQRRARMPTRGKTTKIKLKQGNFVHEYPVPNPIRNSVEAKWMAMCESLGLRLVCNGSSLC